MKTLALNGLTDPRARRAALALLDPELLEGGSPASRGPLQVAARYLPAAHPSQIGGDVYDVSSEGDDAILMVADVRGKGLGAARYAAAILAAFRGFPNAASADPVKVATVLDTTVAQLGGPEDFATALLVSVGSCGEMVVVSCGHPAPLILTQGMTRAANIVPALPLGLGSEPVGVYQVLPAAARLLLYTDGLSEARNPGGEFFPVAEQGDLFEDNHLELALDALVGRLINHVRGMPEDDLTLLAAERCCEDAALEQAQLTRLAG